MDRSSENRQAANAEFLKALEALQTSLTDESTKGSNASSRKQQQQTPKFHPLANSQSLKPSVHSKSTSRITLNELEDAIADIDAFLEQPRSGPYPSLDEI